MPENLWKMSVTYLFFATVVKNLCSLPPRRNIDCHYLHSVIDSVVDDIITSL